MWDLQLQCYSGGVNIANLIEIKRIGRFTLAEHGRKKMSELLYDAEKKGYEVIDGCYFSKDHTKLYSLQLVRQGVPLYGDVDY